MMQLWWQQKPQPAIAALQTPTPEQVIEAGLASGVVLTQGGLLDLCREKGLVMNYPTLRSTLAQMQLKGLVVSSFVDCLISGVPVLVYRRAH